VGRLAVRQESWHDMADAATIDATDINLNADTAGINPANPGKPVPAQPSPLDKYGSQMEGLQKQDQAAFDQEQSALAPRYSALNSSLAAGNPRPPDQQKLEAPPNPEDYKKNSMAFASAMAVLGAVASKWTRNAGNASLNAFAGALNGWQSGNMQAYEDAAKQWEQATKQTIDNNKMVMDKYKEVLENHKQNIDEQMAGIQLVATQFHDKMMFDAAAAKNYTLVASIYEKNQQYTEKAATAAAKLQETKAAQDQKNEANAKWLASPPGQQWIGQQPPEDQLKYNAFVQQYGSGQPRSAPAMALKAFTQEYTEKNGHPPSAQEVTDFAANYGGEVKATRDFSTGTQGNALRSFSVAIDHLGVAEDIGKSLQTGDATMVNRVKNAVKQQFGYEGTLDFNFAKKIVGDEITKSILGSGAGTGQDRQDIQAAFNSANSPEQLAGVIKTAKRLMAGQLRGLKQQYGQTTGKTDFDSRLSEPARRELEGLDTVAAPPEAIAHLREHPELQGDFDAKYGNGSAAKVLGGQ
jgi:hypothetical protein